jgi:hypothetical protein
MRALLRIAIIGSILLAANSAAAQGRSDHDTPATQRRSESPGWQYSAPDCRTSDGGWVMCRDSDGNWQRRRYDRRFGGNRWYNSGRGWSWDTRRPLSSDIIADNLHRWNFDDLRDMKRAGDVYLLKAVDPHGRPVRLTVDVFSGRIISSEPR